MQFRAARSVAGTLLNFSIHLTTGASTRSSRQNEKGIGGRKKAPEEQLEKQSSYAAVFVVVFDWQRC
jgi:hypothetical protein